MFHENPLVTGALCRLTGDIVSKFQNVTIQTAYKYPIFQELINEISNHRLLKRKMFHENPLVTGALCRLTTVQSLITLGKKCVRVHGLITMGRKITGRR
jgi:hypothetical protein